MDGRSHLPPWHRGIHLNDNVRLRVGSNRQSIDAVRDTNDTYATKP